MREHETGKVHLRRVSQDEGPMLLAFARRFYAEDGHPIDTAAETVLLGLAAGSNPSADAFFIEENDVAIGYAVLAYGFSVEYGGRDAFIDDLFLLPGYRNRGLGGIVLQHLEASAREAGTKALHLEVMPGNPADRLYLRAGFRDRGSRLLSKRLEPPEGMDR